VQGAWWFGGELLGLRLPWRVGSILAPSGGVLWYPDPVGALLALPFRALGPGGAYTAALLVQLGLDVLVAWWFGARVGGDERTGLVCAVVAGPSAYAIGLVHSGLSEYVGTWTMTACAGALLLQARDGDRRGLVVATTAAATAQSAYYAAFAALFAGVALVFGSGSASDRGRRIAPWAGLGFALAAPLLVAAWLSLHAPDAVVDAATAPGWRQPRPPGVDLASFLAPFDYYHPDTPALGNPGILHVNHLGFLTLALAFAGLGEERARWLRGVVIAWFVLALGPTLVLGGFTPRVLGVDLPLPGGVLWLPGSPFRLVHHPYRMVAVTLPLLGVLGGIALARWRPVGIAVACGWIVVEAAWLSPAPFPLAGTDPVPPDVYRDLPDGVVLDLPPDLRGPNRRYVLWSLSHGHPVPYGVNHWLSGGFAEDPEIRGLLGGLDLSGRRRNRDVPARGPALPPPRDHGGLAGLGVGAVVLHLKYLSAEERTQVESGLVARLGEPVYADSMHLRWDLHGGSP
jgi:hypothetical protein